MSGCKNMSVHKKDKPKKIHEKIRALFLELPSSSPLTGGVNSLNRSTFSGVEKREMDVGKKGVWRSWHFCE